MGASLLVLVVLTTTTGLAGVGATPTTGGVGVVVLDPTGTGFPMMGVTGLEDPATRGVGGLGGRPPAVEAGMEGESMAYRCVQKIRSSQCQRVRVIHNPKVGAIRGEEVSYGLALIMFL